MAKELTKNGRPTKYEESYCDLIVEMASEGASFTEFRAAIGGVTRQTLHNWKDAHPEFLDAYTRAEVAGEAYWDKQMRKDLMYNKEVNSPLIKLYFANRFGWSDKVETKNENANVKEVRSFSDMYSGE